MSETIGEKTEKIVVKGQEITEEDWRGVLALVFTLGTIFLAGMEFFIVQSTVLLDKLLALNGIILAFYFGAKSERAKTG